MLSWICESLEGESGLALKEQQGEALRPNQVRVRNHVASLNFPDALITRGLYQMKLDPPFVPGSEFAGEDKDHGEAPWPAVLALTATATLTILFFLFHVPVVRLATQLLEYAS